MNTNSQNNSILISLLKQYQTRPFPITVNFRELVPHIENLDRCTHFIHSYPAKLLQHIPYFLLNNGVLSKPNDLILDPFSGSGTVALEAMLANRKVVGTDINPLAVLIARAKTTAVDIEKVEEELHKITDYYNKVDTDLKLNQSITNLNYWFDEGVAFRLQKIKQGIDLIEDNEVRMFFEVAFSVCVRRFSFADPNISVPVKIKQERFNKIKHLKKKISDHINGIKKENIFPFFSEVLKRNLKRLDQLHTQISENQLSSNNVKIFEHDIKKCSNSIIKPESVQLIISSPPYVSAQKYIRASRINIEWLKLNKRETVQIEHESIGREHILREHFYYKFQTGFSDIDKILEKIYERNPTRANITYTYIQEMKTVFEKLYFLLKKKGYFALIIGNNVIAGYEFKTNEYLMKIAEKIGFTTKLVLIDDIKSRGLMTNRNKTANLISREYVILFEK